MTPEEARDLLDGTTPGPWGYYSPRGKDGHYDPVFGDAPGDEIALVKRPADWHLIAAAPTLAAMVAGMRTEYAVQVRRSGRWQYSRDEDDFRWQDLAVQMVRADRDHPGEETRLVRRYVTTPEEA